MSAPAQWTPELSVICRVNPLLKYANRKSLARHRCGYLRNCTCVVIYLILIDTHHKSEHAYMNVAETTAIGCLLPQMCRVDLLCECILYGTSLGTLNITRSPYQQLVPWWPVTAFWWLHQWRLEIMKATFPLTILTFSHGWQRDYECNNNSEV